MPEARGSTGSPTVRRRELGALLRALRNERGLTVDQVAAELLCSPSKVSRMETGQRGATPRDIRDLCQLYGVTDAAMRDRMMQLAAAGKQPGWWQSYELDFATYVGLEADAVEISCYNTSVIPGIFQTVGYARATHQGGFQGYDDDQINDHVEVRMRRQARLTGERALRLSVVLDEAVLHRAVGGQAVMAAQLDRLIEVSKLPQIEIRIIPFSVGAHAAMESNFNILVFDSDASDVVYVEGLIGQLYLDRPQDLIRYRQVFDQLCNTSLSPQDSTQLIASVAKLYKA